MILGSPAQVQVEPQVAIEDRVADAPVPAAVEEKPAVPATAIVQAPPVHRHRKKKKKHQSYVARLGFAPLVTPATTPSQPGPTRVDPASVPAARVPAAAVPNAVVSQPRPTVQPPALQRIVDPRRPPGVLRRQLQQLLESPRITGMPYDFMRFTEAQAAWVAVKVFGEAKVAFNVTVTPPRNHPEYHLVDEEVKFRDGFMVRHRRTGRRVPIHYEIDVVVDDPKNPGCCNIEATTEHTLSKHKRFQLLRYTDQTGHWKFLNGGRSIILYAPKLNRDEDFKIQSRFGDQVRICRTQAELEAALISMRKPSQVPAAPISPFAPRNTLAAAPPSHP